jgi:hypothetical protein
MSLLASPAFRDQLVSSEERNEKKGKKREKKGHKKSKMDLELVTNTSRERAEMQE